MVARIDKTTLWGRVDAYLLSDGDTRVTVLARAWL